MKYGMNFYYVQKYLSYRIYVILNIDKINVAVLCLHCLCNSQYRRSVVSGKGVSMAAYLHVNDFGKCFYGATRQNLSIL